MSKGKTSKLLILTALGLSAASLAARTFVAGDGEGNAVSGQVVDAATHGALEGVRVTVKGTDVHGKTGNDGSFYIEKVPGEEAMLSMSRAGYKTREIAVLVTSSPTKWTVALWKSRRR